MHPDQTAPKMEQSDLGQYCLQLGFLRKLSRKASRPQKVVTGGLRVKFMKKIPILTVPALSMVFNVNEFPCAAER